MAARVRFGFNTLGPAGEAYREARVASARSDETPGSSPPGPGAEWTPQLGQASPLVPSAVTSSGARRSGLPPLIALRIQGGGPDEERKSVSGGGRSKPERTEGSTPPTAEPKAEPSMEEASRTAAEAHPFLSGAWIPKFLRDSAVSYVAVAAATAIGGPHLGKLVDVGDFLAGLASGRKAGDAIPVLVREGSERLAREATETAAHRFLRELGEQEARTLVQKEALPRVLKRLEKSGEPITHEAVERELKEELAELATKKAGRRVLREPPQVRLQDTSFSELHAEGVLNSPMKALDDPQRVRVLGTDTSSNVVVLNRMPTDDEGHSGLAMLRKTYPGVRFVTKADYPKVKAEAARAKAELEAVANDPRPERLIDEAAASAQKSSPGSPGASTVDGGGGGKPPKTTKRTAQQPDEPGEPRKPELPRQKTLADAAAEFRRRYGIDEPDPKNPSEAWKYGHDANAHHGGETANEVRVLDWRRGAYDDTDVRDLVRQDLADGVDESRMFQRVREFADIQGTKTHPWVKGVVEEHIRWMKTQADYNGLSLAEYARRSETLEGLQGLKYLQRETELTGPFIAPAGDDDIPTLPKRR